LDFEGLFTTLSYSLKVFTPTASYLSLNYIAELYFRNNVHQKRKVKHEPYFQKSYPARKEQHEPHFEKYLDRVRNEKTGTLPYIRKMLIRYQY
jgi:hypothetical protein